MKKLSLPDFNSFMTRLVLLHLAFAIVMNMAACVITHKVEYSGSITIEQATGGVDISPWIENDGRLILTPGSTLNLYEEEPGDRQPDDVIHSIERDGFRIEPMPDPFWEDNQTLTLEPGPGLIIFEGDDGFWIITNDTVSLNDPWDITSELRVCMHEHRTTFASGQKKTCRCFDCGHESEGPCPEKL